MNLAVAPGWVTHNKPKQERRRVTGTSCFVVRDGHRPPPSRPVGYASPSVRDDSARALVLRDEERARRALWADCERRPVSHDPEAVLIWAGER